MHYAQPVAFAVTLALGFALVMRERQPHRCTHHDAIHPFRLTIVHKLAQPLLHDQQLRLRVADHESEPQPHALAQRYTLVLALLVSDPQRDCLDAALHSLGIALVLALA